MQSAVNSTEQVAEQIAEQEWPPADAGSVALKVAINILDKWQCKAAQKQAILAVGRSTLYKIQDDPHSARLSVDQLERVSYILNIHQALRIIFSNPENVYGFMQMANHNPWFNGKSPLALISSGRFSTLYEVFKRIDAMRSGQW
ncbi:MAG: hypothetical protein ACI8WB_002498 [Phenylobacterium sp.]|jgi:hypothetical protein